MPPPRSVTYWGRQRHPATVQSASVKQTSLHWFDIGLQKPVTHSESSLHWPPSAVVPADSGKHAATTTVF
jgi:hypothetical protein